MRAYFENFEEDTMNITICRLFCFVLICDRWRHCFKANKLHSVLKNIHIIIILATEGRLRYFLISDLE